MTSTSGSNETIPTPLLDEAGRWLIDLNDNPHDANIRQQFEHWLCLSPEHRAAWEQTQLVWSTLDHAEPAYEAMWRDAGKTVQQPAKRGFLPGRFIARHRLLAPGIVTASLCLALILGPDMALRLQADHRTATAQSQSVQLEDGSIVHLAGASAIATDFSGSERKVRLLAGGAYFDVVPDKARPFTVTTQDVDVTVLGTKFDVQIDGDVTEVALAEGAVKASISGTSAPRTEILAPGDLLRADRTSGLVERTTVPVEDIAGWRTGQIFVMNATIGSVVEQIGRYHSAWLSLPDATLASQRVTGFYPLHDPDAALKALVGPFGGKVRHASPMARIISRF